MSWAGYLSTVALVCFVGLAFLGGAYIAIGVVGVLMIVTSHGGDDPYPLVGIVAVIGGLSGLLTFYAHRVRARAHQARKGNPT